VQLPDELHLKHLPNHDIIVDSDGNTVVGHLPEGIADRQGNLSEHAREILRDKGYHLVQDRLEGPDNVERYMTTAS
jgi:hypothetical protein